MSEKKPVDYTNGGEPIEGSGFENEDDIKFLENKDE